MLIDTTLLAPITVQTTSRYHVDLPLLHKGGNSIYASNVFLVTWVVYIPLVWPRL